MVGVVDDMDVVRVGGCDLTRRNVRRYIEGRIDNNSSVKKTLLADFTHRARVSNEYQVERNAWSVEKR